jgi:hypothetical protein
MPHFLHNQLRDDGEVVSLKGRPRFIPTKIAGTFLLEAESTPELEELGKLKKNQSSQGNRTRDFPFCGVVPQPATLPRSPDPD